VPLRKVQAGHPDFEKLWAEEAEEKAAAERAAAAKAAAEAKSAAESAVEPAAGNEPCPVTTELDGDLASDAEPPAAPSISCETADGPQRERLRPGPKPLLDDALQKEVCVHLRVGLSRSVTAASLGIHKSTISRTIQRDPEFRRQVLLAEATYQKTRTLCLLKSARESWRAGAWMYKHYHPHLSTRRMQRAEEARFAKEAVRQMSEAIRQGVAKAA
jgi:hypothetical protein